MPEASANLPRHPQSELLGETPWSGQAYTYCRMFGMLLGSCAAMVAFGTESPLWFQPTVVGVLWGTLFSAGYILGGIGRGDCRVAALSTGYVSLASLALMRATDLGSAESLVTITLLVTSGWLAATTRHFQVVRERGQRFQISIWDLGFVTAATAGLVHGLPRIDQTGVFLLAVFVTLISGIFLSWFAARWVDQDYWTPVRFAIYSSPLLVLASYVGFSVARDTSLIQSVNWLITGPINVLASQSLTVIISVALLRSEK